MAPNLRHLQKNGRMAALGTNEEGGRNINQRRKVIVKEPSE
jgi:hypothetical protein